jgi:hypothetical protein
VGNDRFFMKRCLVSSSEDFFWEGISMLEALGLWVALTAADLVCVPVIAVVQVSIEYALGLLEE